ncbi:MAG: hypothetical protein K0R24_1431 [Gammaproteobacteria bacterium]|jgi:hypothetical protein|nr:hypothetical protein [Gammaproteobacteria bacterium]
MKNIIAISLGLAVGLMSVVSHADEYYLGSIQVNPGSNGSVKLTPLKDKFTYTVTCDVFNHGDEQAAIKISQTYNDFGDVTFNGEPLNKNNGRETVQGRIKGDGKTVIVINNVNDNSGTFSKDYLTFDRSVSGSSTPIDVSCSAEAPHNPTPPAPSAPEAK